MDRKPVTEPRKIKGRILKEMKRGMDEKIAQVQAFEKMMLDDIKQRYDKEMRNIEEEEVREKEMTIKIMRSCGGKCELPEKSSRLAGSTTGRRSQSADNACMVCAKRSTKGPKVVSATAASSLETMNTLKIEGAKGKMTPVPKIPSTSKRSAGIRRSKSAEITPVRSKRSKNGSKVVENEAVSTTPTIFIPLKDGTVVTIKPQELRDMQDGKHNDDVREKLKLWGQSLYSYIA